MSRRQWASALAWASAVLVLASLPYVMGLVMSEDGRQTFAGFTYNLDDACVYCSWIKQAADGRVFYRNLYTNEPQPVPQFNLFFVVLGLFSRLTSLSPVVVMHIARAALGIGVLLVIWRFAAKFLASKDEISIVVPIAGFASGLGYFLPKVAGHKGSVDLWQPEAVIFLSIYLNPLFLAGLILMLGAFHFLIEAKESGRFNHAFAAGFMLLLLGNIHTYDILTVGAVWAAYLAVDFIDSRKIDRRTVWLSLTAALCALPSVGYQFYQYSRVEVFRSRVETAAPSPAFWAYLAGFGLLIVGAAAGAVWGYRRRWTLFLIVWSVAGFALPYIPFSQQRKLVMGLQVPLVILSVTAISNLLHIVGRRFGIVLLLGVVLLISRSNFYFIERDMDLLSKGMTAPYYPAFLSDGQMRAFEWLHKNTGENDTIFAPRELAVFVPAFAGRQVYYGHWSETPNFAQKYEEWLRFISVDIPDEDRIRFLHEKGINWVLGYKSPSDSEIDLAKVICLRKVFESGDVVVYKVI